MKNKIYLILAFLISCSDKEQVANLPPVASFDFFDEIDKFSLASSSKDPEGSTLIYNWTTTSDKIKISNPESSVTFFNIPDGNVSQDVEVMLTVSDGKNSSYLTKTISVPPLTQIRSYGLGKNLVKEVSNNANYEWYIDQATSGQFSLLNCGPASVTMGIKWYNGSFTGTALQARDTYPEGGGWWYSSDIITYLGQFNVPNRLVALTAMSDITSEIDQGNIIILCLDMYYVELQSEQQYHFNKFYPTEGTGWGHFIVVKGYKSVDGQDFFEVYDPYSFDRRYSDNSLMGKNRYYKASNIDQATKLWWKYAIVISARNSTGGRVGGIDPTTIVHMPGR